MFTKSALLSVLVAASLIPGCSKSEEPASAQGAPAPAKAKSSTAVVTVDPAGKAREIFSTRCTPCHGAEGRGDGAASASLTPKPRNFHDQAWQATIDEAYLIKIIQYGGAAVGKSPGMPANPDLKDQAVLTALAAHVRELGQQP
jgi:hypothetical protein